MGVRVAYGQRKNVSAAIASGVIPNETIIITKDDSDSELLFYDANSNLRTIAERTRFDTLEEAEAWAKQYPCVGFVFSVKTETGERRLYSVNDDSTLSPADNELDENFIIAIDGGTFEE